MDWGKIFAVANLAVSIDNAFTLHGIQKQAQTEALRQQYIEQMRDFIFRIRQTAESVLAAADASPKRAATAMKMLEKQLDGKQISTGTFREIADKEYAHATTQLIQTQSAYLYAQLSVAEQGEVDEMLAIVDRLPEYDWYLAQYDAQMQLQQAQRIVDIYQDRNSISTKMLLAVGQLIVSLVAVSIGWGLASGMPSLDGQILVTLVVFVVVLSGYTIFTRSYTNMSEYNFAKKTVDRMEDTRAVAERFHRLHQQFGDNEQAQQQQADDIARVRAFFGNSNLLLDA